MCKCMLGQRIAIRYWMTMGLVARFFFRCFAQPEPWNQCGKYFEFQRKYNNVAFCDRTAAACKYAFLSENYMYAWVVSAHLNGLGINRESYVAMPHTHTHPMFTQYAREFNPIVYLFVVCFASIGWLVRFVLIFNWYVFDRLNYLLTRKWKWNQNSTIQTFAQNININIHFYHLFNNSKAFIVCYFLHFHRYFFDVQMSFAIITHANCLRINSASMSKMPIQQLKRNDALIWRLNYKKGSKWSLFFPVRS